MKRRSFLAYVAMIAAQAGMPTAIASARTIKILGTLLGYDKPSDIMVKPEEVSANILLVRVDKVQKGKETAKYLRIQYVYWPDEPPLPQRLFESTKPWRFVLQRNTDFDLPLSELLYIKNVDANGKEVEPTPRLVWMNRAKPTGLPSEDTIIPCYDLEIKSLKLAK